MLYYYGKKALLNLPMIAVVGSRRCTGYGEIQAAAFSQALAEAGVCVVSGMAKGIDSQAHLGALRAGGATAAVLGCGADVVYPSENRKLYQQIRQEGLALSEYPPEIKTERYHFPVRNRIISALGEGLLVISAGKRSGTAYTAGYTEALSRQIFALPYNVNVPSGEGCNEYIRKGAVLTVRPEDILDFYNIERKETPAVSMTERCV